MAILAASGVVLVLPARRISAISGVFRVQRLPLA